MSDQDQYLPQNLTAPQREAIAHEGSPLLIIAGPGSGKTEVLAWRVAYLVRSGRVLPENVLAATFTNKAALGLKDRIQQKLVNVNVESMQVSTIHSFASYLLRRFSDQTTFPHGFRLLDETGQFLFIYSNRNTLGLGEIVKGRPQDFFAAVLRVFNLATEELVNPDKLIDWYGSQLTQASEKEVDLWKECETIAEAYQRYTDRLRENSLVDFAFLQYHALSLLENRPLVVEELRKEYRTILVDEYQDTNAAQERIIASLAGDGRNLTVVGDDDQGIYRFRGATVKNILTFPERYPNTHIVKLVHNFRSREPIVDHSLDVINHNPARFPKDLHTVRGPGSEVLLVYEHSAPEEAEAAVHLIQRLHEAGRIAHYGDVVILLRSVKSYAEPYTEALASEKIPYQVSGDASLFERAEIARIYDLFNFLGTTKAWGDKFLRDPLVGFGRETIEALKIYKESLYDLPEGERAIKDIGVKDKGDRARLLRLLAIKRKVQAQEHLSALEIFYDLLAATECVARLENIGDPTAISDLGVLSRLIAAWDEYGSTRNFYPFREYLKLVKDSGVDPTLPPANDAVRIMTIHQAKGLEFPAVVLGAAMDGRLPSSRRGDPYDIPYSLCASGGPEPGVTDTHLVDERKLFYVAATRARDLLVVGTADVVNKRGGGPSPFLEEMFGSDLRAAAVFSEEKVKEVESQPQSGGEPRPRTSFSQLAFYLQCPMRYKFAVVYGLEVPWLDPVDFGANVHRCLEALHQRALRGDITLSDELPGLVKETWLSTPRSQPEQEAAFQQAAVHQLAQYLQGYGDQLKLTQAAETIFSFPFGEDVLLGKVDLIRKGVGEGVEIVDFKTSASTSGEMERVALQLSLYALGMESGQGFQVSRLTTHFLEDGQVVHWDWTSEHKDQAKAELTDLLTRIHGQQFLPRLAYCQNCSEFRAICPHFQADKRGKS